MKRFLLLAALCCSLPLSAQWMRQPTPNDTLRSAVALPDGKVVFQLYAPKARTVAVVARLDIAAGAARINKTYKAFVFTQGGPADIAYQNCANTRKVLQELGLKFDYQENAQAGHSWTTWRADLEKLAPTLFR